MRLLRLAPLLLAAAFTSSAQADILQKQKFTGAVESVKMGGNTAPVLINGRPALEGEFPGLVRISSNEGSCSAQVTGKNSLATAAHCIPATKQVNFVLSGVAYAASCMVGDERALDIAICKLDKDVPDSVKFITIPGPLVAGYGAKKGDTVLKSGYGCTTIEGTGGNDGILRIGSSVVVQEFWKDGKTKREQYFETQGISTVCYGDSGGAVLAQMKDNRAERHILLGINSRVYTDAKGRIINRDILVDVAGQSAQKFIADVVMSTPGLEICGVNVACENGVLPETKGESQAGQCKEALKAAVEKCGGF